MCVCIKALLCCTLQTSTTLYIILQLEKNYLCEKIKIIIGIINHSVYTILSAGAQAKKELGWGLNDGSAGTYLSAPAALTTTVRHFSPFGSSNFWALLLNTLSMTLVSLLVP